jgi:hypothetical protein
MNWFQANRWLGRFLIAFGVGALLALVLLFIAKSSYRNARTRFDETMAERNRLERRDPFPSEENFRKLKVHIDNYGAALEKFREDLKDHVLPTPPLAPNEFQSRLRQAMTVSAEKARANKVRLPDNFHLGFDEFAAALPPTEAAASLGQELAQMELLVGILIDARVDSVTALTRKPLPPGTAAAGTVGLAATGSPRKPAITTGSSGAKVIERNVVDLTFVASPSAARKALNQIASANQQLYIIRTLHVRNEKEKAPPRQGGAVAAATATTPAAPASAALNFIVGNEHIETSARIEMLRLSL